MSLEKLCYLNGFLGIHIWYPFQCTYLRYKNIIYISGYKLLLRGFLGTNDDRYNTIAPSAWLVYNKLWGVKVLEKMKITCWHYINNFLPTKVNLYQCRLGSYRMCPRCGTWPKTILHVRRDSLGMLQIWHLLNISWNPVLS